MGSSSLSAEFRRGIPGGGREPLTITARAEHGVLSFKPAVVYQQTVIIVFEIYLANTHGGRDQAKTFEDYREKKILKAFKKAFTKCLDAGSLIASHGGEIFNSKSESHQPKVMRTTTRVLQGGAEVLAQLEGG